MLAFSFNFLLESWFFFMKAAINPLIFNRHRFFPCRIQLNDLLFYKKRYGINISFIKNSSNNSAIRHENILSRESHLHKISLKTLSNLIKFTIHSNKWSNAKHKRFEASSFLWMSSPQCILWFSSNTRF